MLGSASMVIVNTGIIDAWPPTIVGMMPTGSMSPYIEPGDVLLVDNAAHFQDVKVDDVIVYALDHNRIAHRVVERTDSGLITKGDANPVKDTLPVTEEQHIGIIYDFHEMPLLNDLFTLLPTHALVSFPNNYLVVGIVIMFGIAWRLFFQARKPKMQV